PMTPFRTRRLSITRLEGSGEVAAALETAGDADRGHRQTGLAQQLRRFLKTNAKVAFGYRLMQMRGEQPFELAERHAGQFCQLMHSSRLLQRLFHFRQNPENAVVADADTFPQAQSLRFTGRPRHGADEPFADLGGKLVPVLALDQFDGKVEPGGTAGTGKPAPVDHIEAGFDGKRRER